MDVARLMGTPVEAALRSVIADWIVTTADDRPDAAPDAGAGSPGAGREAGGTDGARSARAVSGLGTLGEAADDLPPATATPAQLRAAATGLTPPRLLDPGLSLSTLADTLARLAATAAGEAEAEAEALPQRIVHQHIDTASPERGERHAGTRENTVVTIALGRPDEDAQKAARRPSDAAPPVAARPEANPADLLPRQAEVRPDRPDPAASEASSDRAAAEADADLDEIAFRHAVTEHRAEARREAVRGAFDPASLERPTAVHAAVEPDYAIGGAILNAAMIPGWPPPRPFATAFARQMAAGVAGGDPAVQEKLLAGLGALGIAGRFLEKLRKRFAALRRRPEVAIATGVLFASIMAIMEATANELEELLEEEDDRERAFGLSGRHRIDER